MHLIRISLINFLALKGIRFENNSEGIAFESLNLEQKEIICHKISFSEGLILFSLSFEVKGFNYQELIHIVNQINSISNNCSLSVEFFDEDNENDVVVVYKFYVRLEKGQIISPNFWDFYIHQNIVFSSNFLNFFAKVKKKFRKSYLTDFDFNKSKIFKTYTFNCLKEYLDNENKELKILNEEETKMDYEQKISKLKKGELNIELNKQIDIYKYTKDKSKLEIISKYLKK